MKKFLLGIYNSLYKARFLYVLARWTGGKYFDAPAIHPLTLFTYIVYQRIFRINWKANWPVHHTTITYMAEKIVPGDSAPGMAPFCYLDGRNGIVFGNNIWMAPHVFIESANHKFEDFEQYTTNEPVKIGDNCWLGLNVIILPGVQLGNHVVVAAGSVVTKSFPEGDVLIAGVPAKIVKAIGPYTGSGKRTIPPI